VYAAKYGSEALDKTREEDLYGADRLHTLSSVLFEKYVLKRPFSSWSRRFHAHGRRIGLGRVPKCGQHTFFPNRLAALLLTRFERSDDSEDLNRSIVCVQRAVSGSGGQHSVYLGNLGHSLLVSWRITKDTKDLEKAISLLRTGLETCPSGRKSGLLGNLGSALSLRFRATADYLRLRFGYCRFGRGYPYLPARQCKQSYLSQYMRILAPLQNPRRSYHFSSW
jgi:hypothetical protein